MTAERRSRLGRGGWLLVALLLAVGGAVAWLGRGPEVALDAAGSRAPAEVQAFERTAAPAGPALVGVPTTPRPVRETAPGRWRLHVQLRGLAPEDRASVVVSAGIRRGGAEPPSRVTQTGADAQDRVTLDVSDAVRHGQGVRYLEVDAAGALPYRGGFQAPDAADERAPRGGDIEVEAVLTPCSVLSGRVVFSDGRPAAAAQVGVVLEASARPDEPMWDEIVQADADGYFRVRCARAGHVQVLAHVPRPRNVHGTAAPAWPLPSVAHALGLTPGERRDLGTLYLAAGATQDVLLRDPQGRAVTAMVYGFPLGRVLHGGDLTPLGVWQGGSKVALKVRDLASPEGVVVLGPLLTGRMWIDVADHPWGGHATREVLATRQRLIEVPSEPVTFELRRALLVFDVRRQDVPVRDARLLLETPSLTLLRARADGRGEIVVPPEVSIRVTAATPDGSSAVLQVETPAPGDERTVRVDLEPGRPLAHDDAARLRDATTTSLELYVGGEAGLQLPTRVEIETARGAPVSARWCQDAGPVTWFSDGELIDAGTASCLTPLPPGDYVLRASAPGHRPARVAFSRANENERTTLRIALEAE
jgi:hypothetical protein